MSVIEDALRRAEQQGRAHRPTTASRAQPGPRPVRSSRTRRPATAAQPSVAAAPRRPLGPSILTLALLAVIVGQLLYQSTESARRHPVLLDVGVDGGPGAHPSPAGDSPASAPVSAAVRSTGARPAPGSDHLRSVGRVAPAVTPVPVDASRTTAGGTRLGATITGRGSAGHVVPVAPRSSSPSTPVSSRPRRLVSRAPSPLRAQPSPQLADRFRVGGVMVGGGIRLAVINGVVVGIGEKVDGAIVRAINARGVDLELDGQLARLQVTSKPSSRR